jgi:hypothetical protein
MEEPDPLSTDDHDMYGDDPWGEYMEYQITELINNLNPGLATNDYSLNSPLIRDRADALLLQLQTGNTTSQFTQNKQLLRSAELLKTHVSQMDWGRVKSADQFHERVTQVIYQGRCQTRQFEQMLQKNRPAAQDAVEIVASFWKATTGTDLNREVLLCSQFDYDRPGFKALGRGEKFWVAHTVVNLINATTLSELWPLIYARESTFQKCKMI